MMTLDNIFGQDQAVETLRRAYAADRLPHGLIFAGPAGVGKATTAAALAALFLCEKPKGDAPCAVMRCTSPASRRFHSQAGITRGMRSKGKMRSVPCESL